jgi:AraC family transcriptional regulator
VLIVHDDGADIPSLTMDRSMQYSEIAQECADVRMEPSVLPNLAKLLDGARKQFDADRDAAKSLLMRAASLLRVEIDRQSAGTSSDSKAGGLVGWQVRRLNAFIEARLDQSIRLKELSTVSRLSTAYFCRAFKRTFRETPHSYVVRRRLERAESLMLTSDLPLSGIALRCGFSDQAHLCKLFRRQYGQTPAVWRRERTDIVERKAKVDQSQEYCVELH